LYSAGFTLLNSYVGLIFSAMAMDYFPKLSAHASDNYFCRKTINEQAEISFLLLTPFLLIFLLFCPLAIKILFTREFMIIDKMLYWSILGMLFRAASWSISFIFIAKGDARIFFYNEFLASVYTTVFNILGYYFWGLTGIGIAFFLGYFLYLVHMSILSSKLYNIFFQKETFKLFIIQCIFVLSIFITVIFTKGYSKYLLSIPIIILCSLYSYGILDKKVQVTLYLRNSITQIFR
jgi:O-antigen/teichoic acid export membrane protein